MSDIIREIEMGDYTVTLKEKNNNHYVARLVSGNQGGILELEKLDSGHMRVKELDLGSVEISTEHLALMLILIGSDADVVNQINRIQNIRSDFN
ncbi:hypothetical protein [Tuberibacillus sp. Marseille-P3662]|uniref:hypothetical protein n=1 Tax=Tuberibacillus sp. Marseille-P3662 TaxID=1965358 RepID=UPI000A1CF235|nr:hypothetical protein [Tuberibacillus sp. Marseille-P3662]